MYFPLTQLMTAIHSVIQKRNLVFATNGVGKTGQPLNERMKLYPYFTPYTKINYKQIKEKLRPKTIKFRKWEKLHVIGFSNDFIYRHQKHRQQKKKVNWISEFLCINGHKINSIQRQPRLGENICKLYQYPEYVKNYDSTATKTLKYHKCIDLHYGPDYEETSKGVLTSISTMKRHPTSLITGKNADPNYSDNT